MAREPGLAELAGCVPSHTMVLDHGLVTYPRRSPDESVRAALEEDRPPVLRRLIAIAAIVLGLAVMAAAVGSATIWRPDEQVTATLPADPQEAVVVSAPGVLNMVDDEVQVRLVGADQETPLVLAMAREPDLRAWLGTAPYLEITGLSSWEELEVSQEAAEPEEEATGEGATDDATEDEDAEGATEDEDAAEETEDEDAAEETETEAETLPDPAGSDLWVEELTDTGELTYTWNAVPGRWMMVAATDGTEPAPQVEMTWTRQVATPLLVPGLIIGGVVFLAGVAGLVLVALRDREQTRARRARAEERSVVAQAPERAAGRHRGAEAETPVDDLLTGAGAGATADDESLSYAQRLGWPQAESGSDTEPPRPQDPNAAAPAAEGTTSGASATPTAPDGTPLTRRQIREAEAARLAEERQARKKRRWSRKPKAEQKTAEQSDGESDTAASDSSDESAPGGHDLPTGAAEGTDAPRSEAADSSSPELSQWVASGRSGKQAAPIQTYHSEHPGAGLPGGAGSPLTPADQDSADQDSAAQESADQDSADQESAAPAPWWRPWQRRRTQGPGADAPGQRRSWRRKPPVETKGREDSEQDPSSVAQTADPHASGALWRRTWGIEPASGGGSAAPGSAVAGEDQGPPDSDEGPQESTEGSSR